jgi:hypothetical protein
MVVLLARALDWQQVRKIERIGKISLAASHTGFKARRGQALK